MSFLQVLKFTPHLKELRIFVCNSSSHNEQLRNFIKKFYQPIKENNPDLPILIRECKQVEPTVTARYQFGKEETVSLYNKNMEEILEVLNRLGSKQK